MWLHVAAGEIRVGQPASHLRLPGKLPGNYSLAMETLQPLNELCVESILHRWTLYFWNSLSELPRSTYLSWLSNAILNYTRCTVMPLVLWCRPSSVYDWLWLVFSGIFTDRMSVTFSLCQIMCPVLINIHMLDRLAQSRLNESQYNTNIYKRYQTDELSAGS